MDTSKDIARTRRGQAPEELPSDLVEWAAAFAKEAPSIRRMLARHIPWSMVDDALQETFVRAYRYRSSLAPDRALGPFLQVVARRTALELLRREQRPARPVPEEQKVMASRFKQQCLALLDQVQSSGTAIVVTKRGRPVARVVPFQEDEAATTIGSVTLLTDDEDAYFSTGEHWEAEG